MVAAVEGRAGSRGPAIERMVVVIKLYARSGL